MKKILYSVASLGVVAAIAIGATGAFFSDEETSTGNTFQAGAIDLKVDYESYYNKPVGGNPDFSWESKDLVDEKFFNFSDVKPGDYGEGTISLTVYDNPAWACVAINPTMNDDNGSTEPELDVDVPDSDSIFDGELAQNMTFMIWADTNCDNIKDGNELLLVNGTGPITPRMWPIADYTIGSALTPEVPYCLGVEWSLPSTVGNIAQTDKYMADVSFYVEQERNNPNFKCPVQEGPVGEPNALRLENETVNTDGPWTIIDDEIGADLTWTGDGLTFDYSLTGKVPLANTAYALIYYADPWTGDNPGKYIGGATSDGDGNIAFSYNPDLSLDLPDPADENYSVGAKLWLVVAADYNSGTASTGPMTAWNPANYLFEGNVYIHYNDTDFTP